MLTISTKRKTFYINIKLLKNVFESTVVQILKVLSIASGFFGIALIVGSAGNSDIEAISFSCAIVQVLKGFVLCGFSYVLTVARRVLEV